MFGPILQLSCVWNLCEIIHTFRHHTHTTNRDVLTEKNEIISYDQSFVGIRYQIKLQNKNWSKYRLWINIVVKCSSKKIKLNRKSSTIKRISIDLIDFCFHSIWTVVDGERLDVNPRQQMILHIVWNSLKCDQMNGRLLYYFSNDVVSGECADALLRETQSQNYGIDLCILINYFFIGMRKKAVTEAVSKFKEFKI